MPGLTTLGIFHTTISLVALGAGAIALVRDKKITWSNRVGKIYVMMTIVTCVTGFGIFQHGGFGAPHKLGIITLLVLGLAIIAEKESKPFGGYSPYVATISYSLTFFFHLIPGVNETLSRLPVDAPLATGPDDPKVQLGIGICFLLFLIGATLQFLSLKRSLKSKI